MQCYFDSLTVAHKGFTKGQGVIQLIDELDENREKPSRTGHVSNDALQSLRKYIRNLKVYQHFFHIFIYILDSR